MFDQVMRDVEGLSAEELEEVVRQLQALVLVALEGPEQEPERCPHCGCAHIVRKGFDKVVEGGKVVEKVQRYRCNACGKTFTRRTLGLLTWSKLDARTWSDYVGLELRRTSIEDMAESLKVNVTTVHFRSDSSALSRTSMRLGSPLRGLPLLPLAFDLALARTFLSASER